MTGRNYLVVILELLSTWSEFGFVRVDFWSRIEMERNRKCVWGANVWT